jgi:GH35 family endo-1,4-beta-xylanase
MTGEGRAERRARGAAVRRVWVAGAVALAAMAAPAAAPAQSGPGFPLYGKDKFLGNVNELTRPLFKTYFNQVTPENAGKWGSAAGTTRTAPMRWANLDAAYDFAQANGFPFNFHVLVWGNQQPTWMAALPPEEQLAEIKKWFAAVAERYPNIEWLQVVNEPLHDPPDCTHSANQGANCNASGNYARALGGANGTDGTGWDWILNAFRLAKQYFPNTKLMLNDYSITSSNSATTQYLQIIEILKRERLVDVVGEQGHAFSTTGSMAIHKANLDRLAATGVPLHITELDIDGVAAGGVPGDEVQLRNFRRIVPVFWEHPGIEGITVWGWRQPNHWRNAQNAPIVLSDDTPKPAALWLHDYVRGIAPVIRPGQRFSVTDAYAPSAGTVIADDWASAIGRPNLRTFTWQLSGDDAGRFAIDAATGAIRIARPERLDELTEYPLTVRVSDGFHTSAPMDVTVVTGDLANVADAPAGGTVAPSLSLTLGTASFGTFTPGVARAYDATANATVTSTAGEATLSVVDPAADTAGRLLNGAFALAQPVQAGGTADLGPVGSAPRTLVTFAGPVSNQATTLRFRQAIGATEPLRTGVYAKTLTFTLSTTTP